MNLNRSTMTEDERTVWNTTYAMYYSLLTPPKIRYQYDDKHLYIRNAEGACEMADYAVLHLRKALTKETREDL